MESRLDTQYLDCMETMDKTELYNLMTQYGDDVRRYAYAITGNRQQSEDIAQEVFIKVYHHVGSFRGESSFKTWLFALTRNLAINEMKSGYMRKVILFQWVKSRGKGASAEAVFLQEHGRHELREIIMALPVKLREVLVLHLEHEHTMAEIARVIGVSEGTVKSRLHRARRAVEKQWKELEG